MDTNKFVAAVLSLGVLGYGAATANPYLAAAGTVAVGALIAHDESK